MCVLYELCLSVCYVFTPSIPNVQIYAENSYFVAQFPVSVKLWKFVKGLCADISAVNSILPKNVFLANISQKTIPRPYVSTLSSYG